MSRSTSPCMDSSNEASDYSDAWLDEISLEPLVSEPGFSSLCNACRRIFCFHPGDESANHIQYLDTLVRSAQRGCVLCAKILYRIEAKKIDHHPSPQLNIRYQVGWPFGDGTKLGVSLFCDGIWIPLMMLPLGNHLDSFPS